MTARMSARAAAWSPAWASAIRSTRRPIRDRSRLVGFAVVSDSLERTDARWPITDTASESRPVVSFFPSFSAGRFPLAGSSPEGREGYGSHGGFSWRVLSLYIQPCEICRAGGARFAEPEVRDLQSWPCGICRAGSGSFSSPARFAELEIGSVPTFSGSTSLESPFSTTVPASGSTSAPMVAGSCSAACVSLIHVRLDGSVSTARSHTTWQYCGRRFLPPLPRRAYRWSPRRMNPRSWRSFRLERTVRSESSVTLTMVSIFG